MYHVRSTKYHVQCTRYFPLHNSAISVGHSTFEKGTKYQVPCTKYFQNGPSDSLEKLGFRIFEQFSCKQNPVLGTWYFVLRTKKIINP